LEGVSSGFFIGYGLDGLVFSVVEMLGTEEVVSSEILTSTGFLAHDFMKQEKMSFNVDTLCGYVVIQR
jgi:hypothetical protein